MALVNLDIRQAVSDPIPVDIGNVNVQGRLVSQTIQLMMFTMNRNAVWGAQHGLLKSSYPFARVDLVMNRKFFRHEVGDTFKFNYSKYGISGMILRVLQKEESERESENIIVHCMEDIYSVNSAVTTYTVPTRRRIEGPDYTVEPFDEQVVVEPPYAMYSMGLSVLPLACRKSNQDIGFDLYMSIDGGVSYPWINVSKNIIPNGVLVGSYSSDTYSIDIETGLTIEFDNDDVDFVESITWAELFAGQKNVALLGDEIISFRSITPIAGMQYKLEDVIRGRYGTQKEDHLDGELFKLIPFYLLPITNSEIIVGAARKFKLVPYNDQKDGDISECVAVDLTIAGKVYTPYIPINFCANGGSFAARYDTDIVLTWNSRKRGVGAGVGTPGVVLSESDHEGLFEIEVWVGGVLKRTVVGIDDLTWTYTEDMSLTDNGNLPDEVTFKLLNYRSENGYVFESEQAIVICHKNKGALS